VRPKILGRLTECETRPYYVRLPFPSIGDDRTIGLSRISLQRETRS
jgi:hypothetical protein